MNPIPTPTQWAYETTEYITTINPSDWSVWSFADEAINVWNYNPVVGQVVQTGIVVILTVTFLVILVRQLQELQSRD